MTPEELQRILQIEHNRQRILQLEDNRYAQDAHARWAQGRNDDLNDRLDKAQIAAAFGLTDYRMVKPFCIGVACILALAGLLMLSSVCSNPGPTEDKSTRGPHGETVTPL